MRFLLAALVLRAPGLVDEDLFAVDLVDAVQDDDHHEQAKTPTARRRYTGFCRIAEK